MDQSIPRSRHNSVNNFSQGRGKPQTVKVPEAANMAGITIAPIYPLVPRLERRLGTRSWGFACIFAVVLTWIVPAGVFAQDTQVQGLVDRVERLQRELQTLQREVYRGEVPPAAVSAQGAARTGTSGLSTTIAARIELRLSQLEAQLRDLTGQIEEGGYRQTQLRGLIDKLAADTDLRLRQLEQGGVGMASGAGAGQVAGLGQGQGQNMMSGQAMAGGGAARTLGTVPAEDLKALQAERVESASPSGPVAESQSAEAYVLPGGTAQEQYQGAFGLLSQANYGEAELALRAFVEQYPDDPLAGNAKYWLGETYYVRQDFQQAAITFAEAYQQFPDNSKAPDNLLKLGMSLSALGSKTDACGTFTELLKRYPSAAVTILKRAKQERQRLGCR